MSEAADNLEADIRAMKRAIQVIEGRNRPSLLIALRREVAEMQDDLTLMRDPPPSAVELLRQLVEAEQRGGYPPDIWRRQVERRLQLDAPRGAA